MEEYVEIYVFKNETNDRGITEMNEKIYGNRL